MCFCRFRCFLLFLNSFWGVPPPGHPWVLKWDPGGPVPVKNPIWEGFWLPKRRFLVPWAVILTQNGKKWTPKANPQTQSPNPIPKTHPLIHFDAHVNALEHAHALIII